MKTFSMCTVLLDGSFFRINLLLFRCVIVEMAAERLVQIRPKCKMGKKAWKL